MRLRNTLFITMFLLCTTTAVLIGAPIAEDTYRKIQEMDVTTVSMEKIMQEYGKLHGQVTKIAENARKEMTEARKKGDRDAYVAAYQRYASLGNFVMGKEETDRLLARILAEPEDKRAEYAMWLYESSGYYRPTLNIDFSLEGEGYRYSYTQRLQQKPGTQIVLPDERQIRTDSSRTGILAGWGLTPESVSYQAGETITMPLTDQTLYAIYKNAVRFTDDVTNTEVSVEVDPAIAETTAPTVSAPDSSHRFLGWYDRNSRTLVNPGEQYVVAGKGAVFEGLWKHLSVEAINTVYYGFDRLPVKTQVGVGFSIANKGNTNLTGLTATLSTESPYVTFLQDSLPVRDLPAGSYRTNNSRYATRTQGTIAGESNTFRFIIDESAPSQTQIPFILTLRDTDGESWTSQVTFTVR